MVFDRQAEEMKGSKKEVYAKVSKYMPFDMPIYLIGVRDRL